MKNISGIRQEKKLRTGRSFLRTVFLLFGLFTFLSAGNKQARIIFISSDGVCLSAGMNDSLAVGDTLSQGDIKLQITAAAGRSSVASVLPPDSSAVLEIGSLVDWNVTVSPIPGLEDPDTGPLSDVADPESLENKRFSAALDSVVRRSALDPGEYRAPNSVHGQLQQNLGLPAVGDPYLRTRIGLQLRLHRPIPIHVDLSASLQGNAENFSPLLYRLEIGSILRNGRLELSAGRLSPGEIAGLGALEGLKLGYHPGSRWALGILAGMRINDYNAMIYAEGAKPGGGLYLRRDGKRWKGQLSLLQEYLPVTRYDIYGHPVRFESHQEIIYSLRRSVPQGLEFSLRGNLIRDKASAWLPQRLAFSTGFRNKQGFYWRRSLRSQIIRTDSLITFSEFERIIEDFTRSGMTHSLGFRAMESLHLRLSHSSQVFSSEQDLPDVLTLSAHWRRGIYVSSLNLNQVFSETVTRRYDLNLSRQGKVLTLQPGWRLWQRDGLNAEQSLYLNAHFRSGRWTAGVRSMLSEDIQGGDRQMQHYLSAGFRW